MFNYFFSVLSIFFFFSISSISSADPATLTTSPEGDCFNLYSTIHTTSSGCLSHINSRWPTAAPSSGYTPYIGKIFIFYKNPDGSGRGEFYFTTNPVWSCPSGATAITSVVPAQCPAPTSCPVDQVRINGACSLLENVSCPSGTVSKTIPNYPSGTSTVCLDPANATQCRSFPVDASGNLGYCTTSGTGCMDISAANGLPFSSPSCTASDLANSDVYDAQMAVRLVKEKLAAELLLQSSKSSDISTGKSSPTVPVGTVGVSDGTSGNGSGSPTVSATTTGGSATNGLGIGDGLNSSTSPDNPDCDGCPTSFSPGSQIADEYEKTKTEGSKANSSPVADLVSKISTPFASTLSPVFSGTCVSRSYPFVIANQSFSISNSSFCGLYSAYLKFIINFLFGGYFVINSYFFIQSTIISASTMGK